jgi:DNA-directed RNA polymerase specialized sigma24 family protein
MTAAGPRRPRGLTSLPGTKSRRRGDNDVVITTPIVTDAALVAAVADGDMSALRDLYARHGAWLHARLLRRCNDPDVVVEVVQDTFVALWQDARRFRHEGEVGAWLWGIAFRRMVSRLRALTGQQFQGPNSTPDPVYILFEDFTHVKF